MADIHRTRNIAAPPQAVWEVLADFGAISGWADNVDHSCVLEHGPDGVRIGETRRVQAGRVTLLERIIAFDPPHTLAYDISGLPKRLRVLRNRWTIGPGPSGSSVVALASTVEIGPRSYQRLAEHLIARVLAKQSETMLAGLANRSEQPGG